MKQIKFYITAVIIAAVLLSLNACSRDDVKTSGTWNYKDYSEDEIHTIKTEGTPDLIMGAGIVSQAVNPKSDTAMELLKLASQRESPETMAVVSLINYSLIKSRQEKGNTAYLKQLKEYIERLLKDDKDNALSYYFNALLLHEEGENHKALNLIIKGNSFKSNGYIKQRFYAIASAAEKAAWGKPHSRELALENTNYAAVNLSLKDLCIDLQKDFGQEAQNACMDMGRKLEQASLLCWDRAIALAIQQNALSKNATDDVIKADIIKRREKTLSCGECERFISKSEISDEEDERYYEIIMDKGEAAAQEYICKLAEKKG